MLHALATLALCIFIGERLWHYVSAWRLHRASRRYLAALYPPPPRQRASLCTLYEPEQRAADRKALHIFLAVFACSGAFLILRAIVG